MLERLKTLLGVLFPPDIEFLNGSTSGPCKSHDDDACDDLKAIGTYTLLPGKQMDVLTDRQANIPSGYFVDVRERSGLSKQGIRVVGAPKTIDAGYTGNWIMPMKNETSQVYTIHIGDRIAQWRLVRVQRWNGKVGTKPKESTRGTNRFGSSGK